MVENFSQISSNPSVIKDVNNGHVPPIPSHNLTLTDYNELVRNLPQSPLNLICVLQFSKYFQFKDILYVPIWKEQNSIYCIRIITQVKYAKSRECRITTGVGHRPIQLYINNDLYYGLEEAMYFILT